MFTFLYHGLMLTRV